MKKEEDTMRSYVAVVEKEGASAYGIWFPDVEGCFSAADDRADVIPNATEALRLHLDGQPLPPARSMGTLAGDPDVTKALSGGGWLAVVLLGGREADAEA